jgi:hypothetical protein
MGDMSKNDVLFLITALAVVGMIVSFCFFTVNVSLFGTINIICCGWLLLFTVANYSVDIWEVLR